MKIFKKLFTLLTPKEYKKFKLLLVLIFIEALLDMIGIASIMPFIAVLTDPSLIDTNFFLKKIFEFSKIFGIENNFDFSFLLGFLMFFLLVLSLITKGTALYYQYQFIHQLEKNLGKRLLETYLIQKYSWFLDRHSANLGKNILSEINLILSSGIRPTIELISKGLIVILIFILLLIIDIKLTLTATLTLCFFYLIIYLSLKKYLKKIGDKRLKSNKQRFILIDEVFGAIKEVKLAGLEKVFVSLFSQPAENYAKSQTSFQVISQAPRFFLEGIAFGGVILIILFSMYQTNGFINSLPVLSLYVLAGYRLIPALQQIYNSFSNIKFVEPSIEKLFFEEKLHLQNSEHKYEDQKKLFLNKSLKLKDIHYSYPNTLNTSLKNINLSILAKSIVGITGDSGSGKSTLIDVFSGLLRAQKGSIFVDDKEILDENVRSWQNSIGYVPQNIFLFDNSIAANIAFTHSKENINYKKIEEVSKIANLHNFILDELPEKYQTKVGERGVRLSGGQLQRIGIARAMYNSPSVLILDEATSALDVHTEKSIMDSINTISQKITVIIIAHRLNTLKNCEKIFLLEKGEIKKIGSHDEIISVYNKKN
ncbi:ABC transporter ATP-binding protein [Candidatus Pelagibacter sp.]|nr:ABC transporter ATP-binding protein [Candidatus Pelagibacter sp.]